MRFCLLGFGLLLLVGCSHFGSGAPRDMQGSSLKVPLEDVLEHGLTGRVSSSLDEIVTRFGEPERVESERVVNTLEPGQTDTLSRLYYDGLQVQVYEVSALNKAFITSLVIDKPRYQVGSVGVGDGRTTVEATLGRPDHIEGSSYLYALVQDGLPATMQVQFTDDHVSRLSYAFYWELSCRLRSVEMCLESIYLSNEKASLSRCPTCLGRADCLLLSDQQRHDEQASHH